MSAKSDDHLEEVSTAERIELVKQDNIRRYGQLIIAFFLIGGMMSYLGWYTLTQSDAVFKLDMANAMQVLMIMGVGAASKVKGEIIGCSGCNNKFVEKV